MSKLTYRTLEEIEKRKYDLQADIRQESSQIGTLWHSLINHKKASSKGELAASLISNGITAIDGFLFVRKLIKNYGFLFKRKK